MTNTFKSNQYTGECRLILTRLALHSVLHQVLKNARTAAL